MISSAIDCVGLLYLSAYCSAYLIKFKYPARPDKFNNFLLQW